MTKEEIFEKLQTEVTIRGLSPGTYYEHANTNVKGAVQDLGTKKERLFAKSRILHEFAKRLRVE